MYITGTDLTQKNVLAGRCFCSQSLKTTKAKEERGFPPAKGTFSRVSFFWMPRGVYKNTIKSDVFD